jgi:hypothetical protein
MDSPTNDRFLTFTVTTQQSHTMETGTVKFLRWRGIEGVREMDTALYDVFVKLLEGAFAPRNMSLLAKHVDFTVIKQQSHTVVKTGTVKFQRLRKIAVYGDWIQLLYDIFGKLLEEGFAPRNMSILASMSTLIAIGENGLSSPCVGPTMLSTPWTVLFKLIMYLRSFSVDNLKDRIDCGCSLLLLLNGVEAK